MTKVRFFTEDGLLTGFDIGGHSGYASHGSDIVCAGISSAAYMTVNTVTEIYGIDAVCDLTDGHMCFRMPKGCRDERVDSLLSGLKLHLSQFCEEYPDNVKMENDLNLYGGKDNA